MIGPEPFKINSPEGDYYVNFEIDMYSLSFPIVCPPCSLKREILKYLEENDERKDQVVNAMLIEKNSAVNTHDVLPLLVTISFFPKDNYPEQKEKPSSEEEVLQFHKFIDHLFASGQMDFLDNPEK